MGATSCDDLRQIAETQTLELNRRSHDVAESRETALLGAGGSLVRIQSPRYQISGAILSLSKGRPDHFPDLSSVLLRRLLQQPGPVLDHAEPIVTGRSEQEEVSAVRRDRVRIEEP